MCVREREEGEQLELRVTFKEEIENKNVGLKVYTGLLSQVHVIGHLLYHNILSPEHENNIPCDVTNTVL